MKRISIFAFMILMISGNLFAQKYLTKNGQISFFSDTPLEKIEAFNNQVNTALDITSGDLVFKVLIKSFEFEKALMQEHFNENYMESDAFPNATYKGKLTNLSDINFTKTGSYMAITEGDLTIHGVTKTIKESGTIQVSADKIIITAKFNILLKDYGIKIPNTVINNISESIQISVNVTVEKVI